MKPFPDRFWAKVDRSAIGTGCWLWTGARDRNGYGRFRVPGANRKDSKVKLVHRLAWELANESRLPAGRARHLDHLCRNRACVNPAHLQLVSCRENILRGQSPTAENARKTHCKRGHPLSGRNLASTKDRSRECLKCGALRKRRYRARRAMAAGGPQ